MQIRLKETEDNRLITNSHLFLLCNAFAMFLFHSFNTIIPENSNFSTITFLHHLASYFYNVVIPILFSITDYGVFPL